MRPVYRILLLVGAVFVIYYPSIFAGFNSVDDLKMVNAITNYKEWSFFSLFFPGGGYYYRPMIFLTFLLDHDLWGLHPGIMHFENVLLHLLNTLLVYLVASQLFQGDRGVTNSWFPFFAALIFAWHPVNSESVNWISGRTDLLAAFFILSSLYFLLSSCRTKKPYLIVVSGLCFLLGCLSKETTVFFLPAALWLLLVYENDFSFKNILPAIRRRLVHGFIILLSCGAYFVMRSMALRNHDSGMGHVTGNVLEKSIEVLDFSRVVLKVLGFYLKKLVWPWPLNFGIIDVSDGYVIVGVILFFLCCLCFVRPNIEKALFLMSVCIMGSALLVALGGAAWTPLGERYLYISSAPFVIAVMGSVNKSYLPGSRHGIFVAVLLAICASFSLSTLQRNIVWQDNIKLFTDTVAKSPKFVPARNELAKALLASGEIEKARKHADIVYEKGVEKGYSPSYLNKAKFLVHEGHLDEAKALLLEHSASGNKKRSEIIDTLLTVNQKELQLAQSPEEKKIIFAERLAYLLDLQKIQTTPFNDYRIAKIYLNLGEKQKAQLYFQQAYQNARDGDHYRNSARKLAEQLADENTQ